jgi:hypothetical protein
MYNKGAGSTTLPARRCYVFAIVNMKRLRRDMKDI